MVEGVEATSGTVGNRIACQLADRTSQHVRHAGTIAKAVAPASFLALRFLDNGHPTASNSADAPVAQLDRASGFEPAGRRFNSCRAHHIFHHRQAS
jgi:hypothetical protein